MHEGRPLLLVPFTSPENPLNSLPETSQLKYLKAYLVGANVRTVIIEQNYFDRDYLDEFAAFYSKSAKGYPNICQRLHFFNTDIEEADLQSALGGMGQEDVLQFGYLGFILRRPLDTAPFGRTVLAWYENKDDKSERITPVLREYISNVLGVRFRVKGIPWQQQDRGVSACATIALWSMFHSSAFDANHSVPTTVEITQNALGASSGNRAFPSQGLSISELKEAVFAQNLTPKILMPTVFKENGIIVGFSAAYMASMCAANIRSGYPVLMVGDYVHQVSNQQHAICCIGFREREQAQREPGTYSTMDDETEVFYVHDDNIGPNVRCRLVEEHGVAILETAPPDYLRPEDCEPQEVFRFKPRMMLIGVHQEIRMDAESLIAQGEDVVRVLSRVLNEAFDRASLPLPALSYNTQFRDVRKFFSDYFEKILGAGELLGRVRRSIGESVPPLCLHIGLISVGILREDPARLVDIVYDTTDSALKCPVVAHIIYDPELKAILDQFPQEVVINLFGVQVLGYM